MTLIGEVPQTVSSRKGESLSKYFPSTLGSYWVYEDQNGNEFKRSIIKNKTDSPVDKVDYVFSYEPELETWADFNRFVQPGLFDVGPEWVTFFISDEIEKAVKERLTKEMEIFAKTSKKVIERNTPPDAQITLDINFDVEVDAQDSFHFLPISVAVTSSDKKNKRAWRTTTINAKIKMKIEMQGIPDFQEAADIPESVLHFTILETGKIIGTETVQIAAGTYKDCLKIGYKTETKMTESQTSEPSNPPGETATTLWLAPNIGIVKFYQETEKIFLKSISEKDMAKEAGTDNQVSDFNAKTVRTLELKKYKINSD